MSWGRIFLYPLLVVSYIKLGEENKHANNEFSLVYNKAFSYFNTVFSNT